MTDSVRQESGPKTANELDELRISVANLMAQLSVISKLDRSPSWGFDGPNSPNLSFQFDPIQLAKLRMVNPSNGRPIAITFSTGSFSSGTDTTATAVTIFIDLIRDGSILESGIIRYVVPAAEPEFHTFSLQFMDAAPIRGVRHSYAIQGTFDSSTNIAPQAVGLTLFAREV